MEQQPLKQDRFTFENVNLVSLTSAEYDLFTTGYTVGLYEATVKQQKRIDALEAELALERMTVKHLREVFTRWPYRQGRSK